MTVQRALLVIALVLFILLGLAGLGWLIEGNESDATALLGFGLAAFAAGHLS